MDKHTLKANALAAMRAVVACEWAGVYMNIGQQRNSSQAGDLYKIAHELVSIETDAQTKEVYKNLKEYYDG